MASLEKTIGARVKELRGQHPGRLTQADLAAELGVTVETISRLERGSSMPSIGTLNRVAEKLGVELRDLVAPDATNRRKASSRQTSRSQLRTLLQKVEARDKREVQLVVDVVKRLLAYLERQQR